MGVRKWTEQEIAQLRALLDDGRSARQAAEALGRTKNAVLGLIPREPSLRAHYNPSKRVVANVVKETRVSRTMKDRAEEVRNPIIMEERPDTRSLTGRLAGDPLPGRSALDMRKQQETRI
jgi:hypothetical protein